LNKGGRLASEWPVPMYAMLCTSNVLAFEPNAEAAHVQALRSIPSQCTCVSVSITTKGLSEE